MSGRVRVELEDGRVVRGYRKTLRRNPRRPLPARLIHHNDLHRRRIPQMWKPDVRLGFFLPDSLRAFVSCGQHGPGVYVHRGGFVQVCHGSSVECLKSAAHFFQEIAKGHDSFPILVVVTSSDTPERRFFRHLIVVNGEVNEIWETSERLEPRMYRGQ